MIIFIFGFVCTKGIFYSFDFYILYNLSELIFNSSQFSVLYIFGDGSGDTKTKDSFGCMSICFDETFSL